MFLNARQLGLLSQIMQALAEPHDESALREQIGHWVMDLLQAQFFASFVWQPGSQTFERPVNINMDPGNLGRYLAHYQYHDPITPVMQRYRVAIRSTDVMAQPALMRTEFFNDFLAQDGLHWGVNLYAWQGGQNIGDMRIWRDKRRENFSADELQLLDLIGPAYVAALARARQGQGAVAVPAASSVLASALSPREWQAARMVAQGLADKEIARALQVSVTTVRTHLERSFRKLGVHNRAGLVHALSQCPEPRG